MSDYVASSAPRISVRVAWSTHGWLFLLGGGVVAIGGYYSLPRAGVAAAVLLCTVTAVAAAIAFVAAARSQALTRATWLALALAMTLATLANITNYGYTLLTGTPIAFPSPVDVLLLATYPCFMVALIAMARHERGIDFVGKVLDIGILVVGSGTVWWLYVLQPALATRTISIRQHLPSAAPPQPPAPALFPQLISILYPVLDVVTFAVLIGVLVSSRANPATRMIVASIMVLLVSHSVYVVLLAHGTYRIGGPNEGLWMLSYLLVAAAATHPSSRAFPHTTASIDHRLTLGRLLFLGLALLVGPILLVTHPHDTRTLVWPSSVAFLLVMGRLAWLNRQLAATSFAVEQKTDELRHQALHDPLTGLPNRALVSDRVEQLLARTRRAGTTGSAMFLDLDDFKNVNDTLGHQAGDRLLVAVTARLASTLRDADTIGRMGGDEFVVLTETVPLGPEPQLVAQRLLDVLRTPFELDDVSAPLMVNVSIGIASGDRVSADALLRDADLALYQAKGAGKNRYETFDPIMQSTLGRRTDLQFDLRSALTTHQYRLMYQPIYNLDDLTMIGVEALLRWDHPVQGLISPDEFIPILEQTGQIREVGRWVLHQACNQAADWHSHGDTLDVSVNVSGRQLDDDSIVTDIREALESSGLAPTSLIIEITETALMRNADDTARRLHRIKALGVRIAVDDFGTGYSSLAYLRQFPVDSLKIDRMFTQAITTSPESKALIGTLVQLGKDLGLNTLAEGVETTAEVDLLRHAHVNQAQGFLLAHPLDPHTLEHELLAPTRAQTRAAT